MANTKDEVRVSKNFADLIKKNEGLLYKTLNKLFDIEGFSELIEFSPDDVVLEASFDDFGRIDILIENHNHFLIIENKVHNLTGAQETQVTSYFDLMKDKEKEGKNTFICYLVNDGHARVEFNSALKKYTNSKLVYWNELINYLYKSADSTEKKNIEYFYFYSKDEIDNFELELDGSEKIFGSDVELLTNPFQLSTIEEYFYGSEPDSWILNSFVLPALERIDGITNVHIGYDSYPFAVFSYNNLEYWLNSTMFWNPLKNEWSHKNGFAFYKPWIVGCHKATTEKQMIEYTERAILNWLNDDDAQKSVLAENISADRADKILGDDVEIFSNPWMLANTDFLYTGKKPNKKTIEGLWLCKNILLPASRKVKELSKPKLTEESRRFYINTKYKGIELHFDFSRYYDLKTNEIHEYDSFTFYRPWIIGCRYAKDEPEIVEYTKKAIELWLRDVDDELGLES